MRRIALEELKPGMKLSLPIRCPISYNLLLNSGVIIQRHHIEKLKDIENLEIYVDTPDFSSFYEKTVYNNTVAKLEEIFNESVFNGNLNIKRVQGTVNNLIEHLGKNDQVLLQLARLNNADSYSASHCVNTAIYSLVFGRSLELPYPSLYKLGTGAILHDIGKFKIPKSILKKPNSLTPDEFETIKKHPSEGYEILKEMNLSREVKEIVRDHHEYCDGSGYPNGLTEDKLNKLAKITAISDVYDAVTTDRAYRKKMLPHEGVEILLAYSSADKLDSNLVNLFIKEICMYPVGTRVRLNTGKEGTVVNYSCQIPSRPCISIYNVEKQETKHIDLAKENTLFISEVIMPGPRKENQ